MLKRTVLSLCQVRDTDALGNDILRDIDDMMDESDRLPNVHLQIHHECQ